MPLSRQELVEIIREANAIVNAGLGLSGAMASGADMQEMLQGLVLKMPILSLMVEHLLHERTAEKAARAFREDVANIQSVHGPVDRKERPCQ